MKDLDTIREDHDIGAHLPGDRRDTCPVCRALDRVENEMTKLRIRQRELLAELRKRMKEGDEPISEEEPDE